MRVLGVFCQQIKQMKLHGSFCMTGPDMEKVIMLPRSSCGIHQIYVTLCGKNSLKSSPVQCTHD